MCVICVRVLSVLRRDRERKDMIVSSAQLHVRVGKLKSIEFEDLMRASLQKSYRKRNLATEGIA